MDLTPFAKNTQFPQQKKENSKVRDEKFSIDSFFNTIKDISSGIKGDFFSKNIQDQSDKSYMTT